MQKLAFVGMISCFKGVNLKIPTLWDLKKLYMLLDPADEGEKRDVAM